MIGRVYLIGAGPGDPDLITVKGLRCLQRADVIICDDLANRELLAHARSDCEVIGRRKHARDQDAINRLMVERAWEGKIVVRLKGGDPFLFSRGGEEVKYLAHAGIPFEIVPGVSSALGVPTCAGIPLTQRGVSSSVAIVTGHEALDKSDSAVRWDLLAAADTLVILMGLKNLPRLVERMRRVGKSEDTPVAVIANGTLHDQTTIVSTLGRAADDARDLQSPALIVVGEVVRLRENLAPLPGRGVLAGRYADPGGNLIRGAVIDIYRAEEPDKFYREGETYSADEQPKVNSDDELGENFVMSDLPAGDYIVRVPGKSFTTRVTVTAGELAWVEIGD